MADFVDIHTHKPLENGCGVVNFRLGVDTAVPSAPFSAGIHPWDITPDYPTLLDRLQEALALPNCVALGEIGLDKACGVAWESQLEVFAKQLTLVGHRPVVIHCVRAQGEIIEILQRHKEVQKVIFHGFIGSREQALELTKRGYFISFGFGTLRSPRTVEALRACPPEAMFLETDTSPRSIEELYRLVAEIKAIELKELKEIIHHNFKQLF